MDCRVPMNSSLRIILRLKRGKKYEYGENCVMKNFIICAP